MFLLDRETFIERIVAEIPPRPPQMDTMPAANLGQPA